MKHRVVVIIFLDFKIIFGLLRAIIFTFIVNNIIIKFSINISYVSKRIKFEKNIYFILL